MAEQSLSLSTRCLSFDFIGTNPDESAEDVGTIQVKDREGLWQMRTLFRYRRSESPTRMMCSRQCQDNVRWRINVPCLCQVPNTWRQAVQDPSTMQLYLDFYKSTEPPSSSEALQVRRGHHASSYRRPDSRTIAICAFTAQSLTWCIPARCVFPVRYSPLICTSLPVRYRQRAGTVPAAPCDSHPRGEAPTDTTL